MSTFAPLSSKWLLLAGAVGLVGIVGNPAALHAATGQLELRILDKDSGQPIPCRMHLIGPKKKPFKPEKVTFWNDHFVVPGKLLLKLPLGNYSFVIERGPEYRDQTGHFTINTFADDTKTIEMRRFVDMSAEGWWSGDLDVRRPVRDIELLMQADDLHVAQVLAWRNDKALTASASTKEPIVRFDNNRYYSLSTGALRQPGTELLLFNLPAPSKLPVANSDYPPLAKIVTDIRDNKKDVWVDASKPFWWDLPILVALGLVDSVEIAHSHICRDSVTNNEADGRARDRKLFSSLKGNTEWSQEVYFRLLDCGLRIPPSAGSGSGEAANPVGYNRMYVHGDGELSYEKWFEGLRAGRVFVTNGPLITTRVDGELPGHVFQGEPGKKLELEVELNFWTRDPITYLEIIKDGHVIQEVRFDEIPKTGKLPKIVFEQSGWFLLRAVTDVPKTYRFVMTAPYYVEFDSRPRISKSAAQFFLDWVYQRAKQIKLADPQQQKEVLQWHRQARDYWQNLLSKANAE